jgi:hypothetical protein
MKLDRLDAIKARLQGCSTADDVYMSRVPFDDLWWLVNCLDALIGLPGSPTWIPTRGDVYVLRLSLGHAPGEEYVWGVYATLEGAKEAAAKRVQFEDEGWSLEWNDWEDYRNEVAIYSARIADLPGAYALVERWQFDQPIPGKFDEVIERERQLEREAREAESAEHARRVEQLRKYDALTSEDKERLRADYLAGDLSQPDFAEQIGLGYQEVKSLLRGLGAKRVARRRTEKNLALNAAK